MELLYWLPLPDLDELTRAPALAPSVSATTRRGGGCGMLEKGATMYGASAAEGEEGVSGRGSRGRVRGGRGHVGGGVGHDRDGDGRLGGEDARRKTREWWGAFFFSPHSTCKFEGAVGALPWWSSAEMGHLAVLR